MSKLTGKFKPKISKPSNGSLYFNLIIFATMLLCGVISGCIFSLNSGANSSRIYDELFTLSSNGIENYSVFKSFCNLIKYPFFIFISGFTFLGLFLIPLIFFIKGFFLSFSISSAIRSVGILGATAFFGVQTLLGFPLLFLLAAHSVEVSKLFLSVLKRKKPGFSANSSSVTSFVVLFIFVILALFLCSLADSFITPLLFRFLESRLLVN